MRFVLLAHSQEAFCFFNKKIVGGKMMDYILEILPALVSGVGMTLKVFFSLRSLARFHWGSSLPLFYKVRLNLYVT